MSARPRMSSLVGGAGKVVAIDAAGFLSVTEGGAGGGGYQYIQADPVGSFGTFSVGFAGSGAEITLSSRFTKLDLSASSANFACDVRTTGAVSDGDTLEITTSNLTGSVAMTGLVNIAGTPYTDGPLLKAQPGINIGASPRAPIPGRIVISYSLALNAWVIVDWAAPVSGPIVQNLLLDEGTYQLVLGTPGANEIQITNGAYNLLNISVNFVNGSAGGKVLLHPNAEIGEVYSLNTIVEIGNPNGASNPVTFDGFGTHVVPPAGSIVLTSSGYDDPGNPLFQAYVRDPGPQHLIIDTNVDFWWTYSPGKRQDEGKTVQASTGLSETLRRTGSTGDIAVTLDTLNTPNGAHRRVVNYSTTHLMQVKSTAGGDLGTCAAATSSQSPTVRGFFYDADADTWYVDEGYTVPEP